MMIRPLGAAALQNKSLPPSLRTPTAHPQVRCTHCPKLLQLLRWRRRRRRKRRRVPDTPTQCMPHAQFNPPPPLLVFPPLLHSLVQKSSEDQKSYSTLPRNSRGVGRFDANLPGFGLLKPYPHLPLPLTTCCTSCRETKKFLALNDFLCSRVC